MSSRALWYFPDLFHNEYACKSRSQTFVFFIRLPIPEKIVFPWFFYVDCPLGIHWIFVISFCYSDVAAPMSKFWTVCHFNWISMQSQTSQIKSSVVCSCDLWQIGMKAKPKKEAHFCINFHSTKCLIQAIRLRVWGLVCGKCKTCLFARCCH